ncbi:MAG: YbjN domain-containing protein [Alphaproteobacteria bacterium]|nr:YbjN domain-containing protein [Alphaproteobacteria bacterium]MCZ6496417.1 YbjN domain-containing protein [Alphaproteobacteria bacterium]
MTESLYQMEADDAHPIDLVERVIGANQWSHQRVSDDELAVEIAGCWCDYRLFFAWHREAAAIHFSLALDMRVPKAKHGQVGVLLATINEKLWLGHFDLWSEDGLPMFRYAVLLRGTSGPSHAQIEELVNIAVSECDRFYPAFQFVIWGGKSVADAVACALIDPVGEA